MIFSFYLSCHMHIYLFSFFIPYDINISTRLERLCNLNNVGSIPSLRLFTSPLSVKHSESRVKNYIVEIKIHFKEGWILL